MSLMILKSPGVVSEVCFENLWGGGGVLATWDRLYTKTMLQRHNATDTDFYFHPQSLVIVDALYFHLHCFPHFLLSRQWHSQGPRSKFWIEGGE